MGSGSGSGTGFGEGYGYGYGCDSKATDIVIRTFDTAIQLNLDIERAVRIKHEYNKTRPFRHGKKA